MTHTDPDLSQLRAAVLANPADDTVRLVYADALDGLDPVRVTCSRCGGDGRHDKAKGLSFTEMFAGPKKCQQCDGVGTILDPTPQQRAELVRVQVELAQIPYPPAHDVLRGGNEDQILLELKAWRKRWGKRNGELRPRESELLTIARQQWETIPCEACKGTGRKLFHETNYGDHCPVCRGMRDLLKRNGYRTPGGNPHPLGVERRPVTWERGFPCVSCESGQVWEMASSGTATYGQRQPVPTPWARAVCGFAVGLRLTDVTPYMWGQEASWSQMTWEAGSSRLIDGIYDLLQGGELRGDTGSMRTYPTEAKAWRACEWAVARWVRSHAAARNSS